MLNPKDFAIQTLDFRLQTSISSRLRFRLRFRFLNLKLNLNLGFHLSV